MPRPRKLNEIEADLAAQQEIVNEVERIASDELTDEDVERQSSALETYESLEHEKAEAIPYWERLERAVNASHDPEQIERTEIQPLRRGPEVKISADPFEVLRSNTSHMGEREYAETLRTSNLKAIERFEMPEGYDNSFERMIKRHGNDKSWARNLLARMDPNYISAFEKVSTGQGMILSDVERAAIAVGTNTAGGYLVPTHLDPTLVLTNNGVSNMIRGISRVVTLTGGANKWNGVTTAGATASWDAELTEVSDDTPPIAPASVPVFSAKALIQASIESFEDITGLTSDVQMLLADAKDRLEAVAHATGSGSGMPTGVFTAIDANPASELSLATGSTITLADLQNVYRQLGVRWRSRASWLMHPLFRGSIQALGTALSASYSTDITQPYTDRLIGRPVLESDEAPMVQQTTTVDNILLFGDFSNYLIVDKPGSTSIEFIPHLFNTSNNLPDGRRAWYMHFRNGADSINDIAFRLLQDKTTA